MTTNDHPQPDEPDQDEIRRKLSAEPSPQIPASVSQRITAALEAEQQRRDVGQPKRNRWWIPLGAAAAIALLVGVIVIPGSNNPDPQPIAAGCQTTVAEDSDLTAVTQQSGRDYTQAELADQAKDDVNADQRRPSVTLSCLPHLGGSWSIKKAVMIK